MVRIEARFDLNQFRRGLSEVQKKLVPRATSIALGRVATTVRKVASLSIRERLAISAAVARKAITIRKNRGRFTIVLEASGRPIPLKEYQARAGKKGVTYRVSKGKSRKLYQTKYGKGFVVGSLGGHVFVRVGQDPPGRGRAPIQKVYGPSVPQYFVTRLLRDIMLKTARDRWPIEFAAAFRGVSIRAGLST